MLNYKYAIYVILCQIMFVHNTWNNLQFKSLGNYSNAAFDWSKNYICNVTKDFYFKYIMFFWTF